LRLKAATLASGLSSLSRHFQGDSVRVRSAVFSALLLLGASVASSAAPLETYSDGKSGRMYAIRVTPPVLESNAPRIAPTSATLKVTADTFIQQNLQLLGIQDPATELLAAAPETDNLGLSRIHYFQRWHGLDVLCGAITVHLNQDGQAYYVKTKVAKDLPINTTPTLTEGAAQNAALHQALDDTQNAIAATVLKSRLIVLPLGILKNQPSTTSYLAWEVEVVDDKTGGDHFGKAYYYDAHSGALLFQLSRNIELTPVTREIKDCAEGNPCQMNQLDPIYTTYYHGRSEGMPVRGPYPNPSKPLFYGSIDVDNAYDYVGALHAYYSTNLGLVDGPNGHGGTSMNFPTVTKALVHNDATGTSPACPYGAEYVVNTGNIFFCKGVVTLDTIGHEYSHAVVFRGFPDGSGYPVYYGESGALNESYADFMGELFEYSYSGTTDWKGRTAPSGTPAPLRDLRNPPSIPLYQWGPGAPDRHYSASVECSGADYGGVHENSTIPSHAMYLFSEGGDFNGCTIIGQGKDAAQKVFFRGWRTYFSSNPTFQEAYTGLIQACTDLYPPSVVAELTKALQAGEMDQPGRCSGIPEVAPPCAVNHAGSAITARNNGYPIDAFPVGDEIWLNLTGATANRMLDFLLLPHVASRPIWQATTALALDTANGTVLGDSTLFSLFGVAMTEGSYDVMIDGNRDGFYQPWADTILPITITPATSGVGDGTRPAVTALKAIQPNPTREGANVAFSLASPTDVSLRVYDVAGRLVRTVASESLPAGTYVRAWDGRDDNGRVTNAGLYFVKFVAGATVESRKLVRTQ